MSDNSYTIAVEKGLEDLIPEFLKNRNREVESLRGALEKGDFDQLRQFGHRMRGVGTPYGFDHVSDLGKRIEDGAKGEDRISIEAAISDYAEYLSRVKVVYA